jgi:methionyl-tRNA synthetase
MPWALAKDETKKARLNDVLYNLTEAIVIGASLLDSFMPATSEKIFAAYGQASRSLDDCGKFGLAESVTVHETAPLFARLDFKTLQPEIEKIRQAQMASVAAEQAPAENKPAPKAEENKKEEEKMPEITIDDFAKVEIRVGEIIACEKVPKSSKLLHETVKFGDEVRSIVSGIGKHYKPEEMVGKKVIFVTNLKPVTICGVLSQGMILCAEDENGVLSVVSPEKAEIESGAKLG